MALDRCVKSLLAVIAVALVVIAVRPWLPAASVLDAVRPASVEAQGSGPEYEIALPKAWGKVLAFGNNNLLIEGPDDTLRVVDVEGKAPKYPKVKVLIRWQ